MNVRVAALALFTALAQAAAVAYAAAEWWSPATRKCPTFATKEECIAWCEKNRSHCRWIMNCQLHTEDEKPSCPKEEAR
jgi:hypothetical protein